MLQDAAGQAREDEQEGADTPSSNMPVPRAVMACLLFAAVFSAHAEESPEPSHEQADQAEPELDFTVDATPQSTEMQTVPKVQADDAQLNAVDLCGQVSRPEEGMVDTTRRQVEQVLCASVLWFDGLFGDDYHVGAARETSGEVELWQSYSEYYGWRTRLRLDADIKLPNLNDRMFGFIGRDDEDDFARDRRETTNLHANFPQVEDQDTWLAGLGYRLPHSDDLNADFRIGASGVAHPKLFVQTRLYYRLYSSDKTLVYVRATPFYTTRDGVGLTSGINYTYLLTPSRLLRFENIGTRSQETEGLNWRSELSLYENHHNDRGLSYQVFVRGETQEEVPIQDYGVEMTYRHPFAGHRLYAEWVLGYSFPRRYEDEDREGSVGVGVGLQMPFGARRRKQ